MICNLMEFVTLPLDFPVYFFFIKMANSDGEALMKMYRTVRIKTIRLLYDE